MLKSMLEDKVNTNQELKDFIDKNMQEYSELHKRSLNSDLLNRINQIFEKKEKNWVQKILYFLNLEEYREVKELTEKAIILEQFCFLAEKEVKMGIYPMLYKFSTLDEMMELYNRTIFGLRRVEIEIVEESSKLLMNLHKEWGFSVEYIFMILNHILIRDPFGMNIKLAQIFAQKGYIDYSERFLERAKECVKK